MTKYIHAFSDPITDEIDQSLIGNKGYNLCLMHGMDLPIPCLLYTSPSPRDRQKSRMPSSA